MESTLVSYHAYPQTRFQGSKYRLLDWMHKHLSKLAYNSAFDAFSGSGVVSYYFKTQQKLIYSNDLLQSSYLTVKALVENGNTTVSVPLLKQILTPPLYKDHEHHIEREYQQQYFTQDENIWLDGIISNIRQVDGEYAQAILYWALFQACIIKRPYNLFHRKNLYMRLDEVKRSFGNKTTWDRPFDAYMRKFVTQANQAIFDNGYKNKAYNQDISGMDPLDVDLVYIDPPYMKQKRNMSGNDYQNYYHFLEGILDYDNWKHQINNSLKHRPYAMQKTSWIDPKQISSEFEKLIRKYQDSTLVISYNTQGYPSSEQLREILLTYKTKVEHHLKPITYALNKGKNTEILFIAQ
ncbi:MAG: DNA adenine methylase [Candidatus Heimdallarchaeota archaeon]|nr:DNA adenine methylase [Candidatus Heimdallarchaeota archaeon]